MKILMERKKHKIIKGEKFVIILQIWGLLKEREQREITE